MEKFKEAYEALLTEYLATLISKGCDVVEIREARKFWMDKIKDL